MSFKFDKKKFFADFSNRTALPLNSQRKKGIEFLLGKFEADPGFSMIREISYVLATIRWETGHTFQPIKEKRFNKKNHPRDWEKQDVYWRTGFYGRGYVQITWEKNYRKAGEMLKKMVFSILGQQVTIGEETFIQNPDYVLEPDAAYEICARGMREGWFTGAKLGDYIEESKPPDYFNSRRIVNGLDHAEDIREIANQFELLLRASAELV